MASVAISLAEDACGAASAGLWRDSAAAQLAYRAGGLLAAGFATRATYDVSADGQRILMRRLDRAAADDPRSVHVVQNWRAVFAGRLGP